MTIRTYYDGMGEYLKDIDYTSTWSVAHHTRFLIFANTIIKKGCKRILDVGFGEDFMRKYLEQFNFNGTYFGLELNTKYLKKAVDSSHLYNFESDFLCAEINVIKTGKFDCIILGEVIEHLEKDQVKPFMKNVYNLLSDNGTVLLSTPNAIDGVNWPEDHSHEFTYDELLKLVNKTGFIVTMDFGLWRNTKETKEAILARDGVSKTLSGLYEICEKYIPTSLMNVLINLLYPRHSKALLFILEKPK